MIAKIVTGKSFGGAVRYLTEKSGYARMLDSDGIDTRSIRDMIGSFNFQRKARKEIEKLQSATTRYGPCFATLKTGYGSVRDVT